MRQLIGLLPICANCKKNRDKEGVWQELENYIEDHPQVAFSHGICPDCVEKLYPKLLAKHRSDQLHRQGGPNRACRDHHSCDCRWGEHSGPGPAEDDWGAALAGEIF
ncbi:hypothetical protein DFAR_3460059 [Desulfarculales bacterium]